MAPESSIQSAGARGISVLERLVPPDSLPALGVAIGQLSRAHERALSQPLRLIDTSIRREGLALVRVECPSARLSDWEIIAVLHHSQEAVTRVEPCAPLPPAQIARLEEARALCETCRTVRPRTRTWLLREHATGRTAQVGSSCLGPFTGAASVERALSHAQALADAHAALRAVAERPASAPGDEYIDTTAFLAHAVAVVRELGFAGAQEADPTWRRALARVEANRQASDGDVHRALEIRAWTATLADAVDGASDGYRDRLVECLDRDRLSSRELPLAASAVRGYNRHLYWRIRREKAAAHHHRSA